MKNKYLSNSAMQVFDRLTDRYPATVPKIVQSIFLTMIGNRFANRFYRLMYARKLQRILELKKRANKPLEKILVIVDVNLGDAVIMQSAALALKDRFPAAAVDYVCNKAGGTLVAGAPEFRRVHNIFGQFMIPTPQELETLRELIRRESYDVVFNLCPFLKKKDLNAGSPVIQLYVPLAAEIIHGWDDGGKGENEEEVKKIHLSYIADSIIRNMTAGSVKKAKRSSLSQKLYRVPEPVRGVKIYLPHEAVAEAQAFLMQQGLDDGRHLVLLHADTPFRFTQIPLQLQISTLEQILRLGGDEAVLLSAGDPKNGLGDTILNGLPQELRRKVILVPRLSIAGYAALIDACDVFISGDTGPLHIAAARKNPIDARDTLKNGTAVIGVYGSTNSRMSAYDSSLPGHIPGRQSAPAKVFVAAAPCRNITCVDKPAKTCALVRCFDGLTAKEIAGYVNSYLSLLREHAELEAKMRARRRPKQRA